jgi:hypothetical protein
MKQNYTAPLLVHCAISFERGYNLSTDIDSWGNGGNIGGDAE